MSETERNEIKIYVDACRRAHKAQNAGKHGLARRFLRKAHDANAHLSELRGAAHHYHTH